MINDSATLASHARAIGYVATPNFLLMSGLACGYQLAQSPTTATALRIVDRGLFAFLVGHLLVTASLVYMVSWLTPWTCPVYLLVSTVIMYWIARAWGQWRANRYMTLGLKPWVMAKVVRRHH